MGIGSPLDREAPFVVGARSYGVVGQLEGYEWRGVVGWIGGVGDPDWLGNTSGNLQVASNRKEDAVDSRGCVSSFLASAIDDESLSDGVEADGDVFDPRYRFKGGIDCPRGFGSSLGCLLD